MIKEYDYLFKLVIVGNQGVGKSSLFLRFSDDTFVQNYLATIGVDFRFKTLDIDGQQVKLQMWDTAGQERFRTITSAYYKNSHAVVVVYDTNNLDSFQEIESFWINEIKMNADKDIQIVLVGTKMDLDRNVPTEMVDSLKDSLGIRNFDVSAKTGEGVMTLFEELCRDLVKKSNFKAAVANKTTKLNAQKEEGQTKKKGCCSN